MAETSVPRDRSVRKFWCSENAEVKKYLNAQGKVDRGNAAGMAAFNSCWIAKKRTIHEIADAVDKGHGITGATLAGGRRQKGNTGFERAQIIIADLDNCAGHDAETKEPIKAQPLVTLHQLLNLPVVARHCGLIYASPTSSEDWPKFRLLFPLEESITDPEFFSFLSKRIFSQIHGADLSVSDPCRLFYGGRPDRLNILHTNENALLPASWAEGLKPQFEAEQARRAAKAEKRQTSKFSVAADKADISLEKIVKKTTRDLLEQGLSGGVFDHSALCWENIQEIAGWCNWLEQHQITYYPSQQQVLDKLRDAIYSNHPDLEKRSKPLERIVGGRTLAVCTPACLYSSDSELSAWRKIWYQNPDLVKKLNPEAAQKIMDEMNEQQNQSDFSIPNLNSDKIHSLFGCTTKKPEPRVEAAAKPAEKKATATDSDDSFIPKTEKLKTDNEKAGYPSLEDRPCYRVYFEAVEVQNFKGDIVTLQPGLYSHEGGSDDKRPESDVWVCDPIFNIYKCAERDASGDLSNWGTIIEFLAEDGKIKSFYSSNEYLTSKKNSEFLAKIRGAGLNTLANTEKRLLSWIDKQRMKAELKFIRVGQAGWSEDLKSFVSKSFYVKNSSDEKHLFLSQSLAPEKLTIVDINDQKANEALAIWKQGLTLAKGNPIILFAAALNFSSVILPLVDLPQNTIVSFVGPTSSGKTTMAKLAISGWKEKILSWNVSQAGVNILAQEHNHVPFILDDMQTLSNSKQLSNILYTLGNGVGKTTSTQTRELRQEKQFITTIVSTAERTLNSILEQTGQVKQAGQLVRWLDIEVTGDNVFLDLHGHPNVDSFINQLLSTVLSIKVAGPAYLFCKRLINSKLANTDLTQEFKTFKDNFIEKFNSKNIKIAAQYKRSLSSVAMIAFAGELAIELNILPFEKDDITNAAIEVAKSWEQNLDCSLTHQSEISSAIEGILDFLTTHQFRSFVNKDQPNHLPNGLCYGYYEKTKDGSDIIWTVNASALKKNALEGMDSKRIFHELTKIECFTKEKVIRKPTSLDEADLPSLMRAIKISQNALIEQCEKLTGKQAELGLDLVPVAEPTAGTADWSCLEDDGLAM